MKKKSLLILLSLCITTATFSQTGNRFWSANAENKNSIITDKAVARLSYPKEFKLYDLDISAFRKELFSIIDRSPKRSTIISLPNVEGKLEEFEIFEASNFEPALQANYPEIRAFSGKGITDKYAVLKLSISPRGIQTMVFRTGKENEFIEPYSKDHKVYAVFNSSREKGKLQWRCSTSEQEMIEGINAKVIKITTPSSNSGEVKTMRLAQSCNAEYANYFGATSAANVGLVLAAFNNTLTRCNGVYENDLGIHLNLIAGSTNVIYYNAATDPYSTLNSWNVELMNTLHNIIGDANFDIGHMFGASGGGGNAGCIGCVCSNVLATGGGNSGPTNSYKGAGITSPADNIPQGDNFDIDYVAHEVGHQLGANHTFSHALEGLGQNKEVGSGITIMGYAGITGFDVAPHSIDIFHATSIAQVQANLATKTCPVTTIMTGNNTPAVAAVISRTIPISTPFALTGTATDIENDPITYCWEQNDNSNVSGAASVADPVKAAGPNWLSFSPTASGTRLFPMLSTILAGLNVTPVLPGGDAAANIEALSSVGRTLNFRLTARDNHPYVPGVSTGQTNFTDMVVTVSGAAGPFAVTAPNTAVTWPEGSAVAVTWSVNNTTAAPINCANVNILLSTDGGNTFPFTLSSGTANDGTEIVTVPTGAQSTTCRVKVEAVGNIFFDISNTNFTIGPPLPPAFTIAPSSVAITCGTSVTRTFTITNVNNSPGTIVYTWDLGSANNGWIYSGSPAPQIITITNNNSITLTSSASATSVSNVSVTVNLNGSNVATLTSTVSLVASGSTVTILGSEMVCTNTTTTYTLQQTPPSGATVTWSIYPDDGSVTLTPSGNSVILDASNVIVNRHYNLYVSVQGPCYQGSGFRQFFIPSIGWAGGITGFQGWSNAVYSGPLVEGDNYLYLGNGATWFEAQLNSAYYNGTWSNVWWEYVSGDYTPYTNSGIYRIGYDLSWYGGSNGYVDSYYNFHYTDECGSFSVPFHFMHSYSYPPGYRMAQPKERYQLKLSPNPTTNFVYVTVTEQHTTPVAKLFNYETSKRITVYDKLGNVMLRQNTVIPRSGLKLNITSLHRSDIYNVVVEDQNGLRITGKLLIQ